MDKKNTQRGGVFHDKDESGVFVQVVAVKYAFYRFLRHDKDGCRGIMQFVTYSATVISLHIKRAPVK